MLYQSKVSMYTCESEGVSTTAAEVRPLWKWSLERQRSVCSLTAYEGMHSSCEQLGLLFPSCRLAKNQYLHGLGCPYDNRKKKLWRDRKRTTMSQRMDGWEFGLWRWPIFVAETLEVDLEEVVLSKFRCHTKKAPTILTSSRTPSQIHQNALHPSDFLTPTEMSSGSGKQRKPIRVEKPFTAGGGSWKRRKTWPFPFFWCANETFRMRFFKRAKASVDTRIREKATTRNKQILSQKRELKEMQDKPHPGKTVLAEQKKWKKVAQFMPNAQNLWHFPKKILGYTPARYNPMAVLEWEGKTRCVSATSHLKNSRGKQIHSKCCAFVFLANPLKQNYKWE